MGLNWLLNPVYTIQPVVKPVVQPVWQPAVSCKRGIKIHDYNKPPKSINHSNTIIFMKVGQIKLTTKSFRNILKVIDFIQVYFKLY